MPPRNKVPFDLQAQRLALWEALNGLVSLRPEEITRVSEVLTALSLIDVYWAYPGTVTMTLDQASPMHWHLKHKNMLFFRNT